VGFHRLSIHCLSGLGNQPFVKSSITGKTIYSICNGEIYNYDTIRKEYISEEHFQSSSDCEAIPFLYMKYGDKMINYLDGEFAFIICEIDHNTKEWKIHGGRDPFGVRPLFYGYDENGIVFGSELKSIYSLNKKVDVFPPGHTISIHSSIRKIELYKYYLINIKQINDNIYEQIRNKFMECVVKRLSSERPLGCLLSGGLDSSIVSAVTAKHVNHPLHTFTIGLEGATDIMYAEMVSKHIKSIHQTFIVTIQEALEAIEKVIYTIESYDCTTVRASVWQYLLGKKIKENTDIKVLLTGEGSDELMSGYMYFHKTPSAYESHLENIRLLEDIHRFDGLRVDRAMSCHGLEVRIPFLDPDFVQLYLSLPTSLRIPGTSDGRIEKQLFRDAFRDTNLLPSDVLYRRKEAFSDGTSGNEKSWFQIIQEHIEKIVTDGEFENHGYGGAVDTKEKYYYKKIFEKYFGSNSFHVIPYYWLPKWCGNITEPSARVLDVYSKT
jgi:asparagine synthase (glutamine-hydrolysing)